MLTVTLPTPAVNTYKSMIPTVSLGRPMPNINPSMTDWRQIKSTSVSSHQTLITPSWLRPHHPNHQHILLKLLNPFYFKPWILTYSDLWILSPFMPLHIYIMPSYNKSYSLLFTYSHTLAQIACHGSLSCHLQQSWLAPSQI